MNALRQSCRHGHRAFLGLALALTSLPAVVASTGQAQSAWSDPIVLFRASTAVTSPKLVADPSGDVHLFFVLRGSRDSRDDRAPGEERSRQTTGPSTDDTTGERRADALAYMRLHGDRWSEPVDVLVSPDRDQINFPAVALDRRGFLHVVWRGGPLAQIYYSSAHVTEAGSARGWRHPQALSEALGGFSADIAAASDGSLHVVYAERAGDVFSRRSTDGGRTWTARVTVSSVPRNQRATDLPRIAADDRGRLHIVWTEFGLPVGWPPLGAFYSRSDDGGRTWLPSLPVDGEDFGEINILTTGQDAIHLVWHGTAAIGDHKHRSSSDGGQNWSAVEHVAGAIRSGFSGFPSLGIDSAGHLHLVTVANAVTSPGGSPSNTGVYYSRWDGWSWSDPVWLSQGAVGQRSVELPWIAVSEGNRLHVVYEDDFERIWYTGRLTAAPVVAAQEVPAAAVTRMAPTTPRARAEPTSYVPKAPATTGEPLVSDLEALPTHDPRMLTMAPVLVLLAVVVALRLSRHS